MVWLYHDIPISIAKKRTFTISRVLVKKIHNYYKSRANLKRFHWDLNSNKRHPNTGCIAIDNAYIQTYTLF